VKNTTTIGCNAREKNKQTNICIDDYSSTKLIPCTINVQVRQLLSSNTAYVTDKTRLFLKFTVNVFINYSVLNMSFNHHVGTYLNLSR